MKEETRKYLVLGQRSNDEKPFICYRMPDFPLAGMDVPENNQYSAENCLCSKKEAERAAKAFQERYPKISYGIKQFLD